MGKRVMNPVLNEETAKKLTMHCMVCSKAVEGWYGRHGNVGTCSGACERIQQAKPRYPNFSEEDFFRRQGETFDNDPDILEQGT